ncbi:hypothetical protein JTE90_026325 [Oedothorax gibbosus]|uniref:Uncharacterized protein n=1 Tax=Oedothorax gibbosus TaxID=931172 RepID=A0AAV6U4K9_9ARAC|nr:hypothetical protein JTE90_026325 [Oedothorax gibbosus]
MLGRTGFCAIQFLFISAIVALGILSLIIGKKVLFKVLGFIRALRMRTSQQKLVEADLQQEVSELRKAALQISEEWAEIKQLMAPIKHQMSNFTHHLDSNLDTMYSRLQDSMKTSLEEECQRNDQRFKKFFAWMDAFKEGFDDARAVIQKHEELMARLPRLPVTEAWTQTEREMAKKKLEKGDTTGEQNQPRPIINVIRKALQEFLKEAKSQMSLQRNEVELDLKKILSQLSEDKDDLKRTIEAAFTMTSKQAQDSFLQFGNVGRDAMNCIASLNEHTNETLTTKFQAVGEKLQKILESMSNLDFDVSCIKQTLDNIDGQFDEIYKKLEVGCQKNTDYAEEFKSNLQLTAQEWNEKSSELDEVCKQLTCATHGIKTMLANLDNALCNRPLETTDTVAHSSNANQTLMNRNLSFLELGPDSIGHLFATVKTCQVKLDSMKDQINQNTCGVQVASEMLLNELHHLHNLVKHSMVSLKNLTTNLHETENQLGITNKPEQEEFVDDKFSILDTISEYTEEESQVDKGSRYSSGIPRIIETIDVSLNKAQFTNFMKSPEFVSKASK